jgi:hypothetical protein
MIRRRQQLQQAAPSSKTTNESIPITLSTNDLEQTNSFDNNSNKMSAYRGSGGSRSVVASTSHYSPTTTTKESFSVLSGASSDMNTNERKQINMLPRYYSFGRQRQWMIVVAVAGGFFLLVLLLLSQVTNQNGSRSRSSNTGEAVQKNTNQSMMLLTLEFMSAKKSRSDGSVRSKFWLILATLGMGLLLLWMCCVKLVQSYFMQCLGL